MDLLWCCPVLSVLILALGVQEGNGFFPTTLLAELAQDEGSGYVGAQVAIQWWTHWGQPCGSMHRVKTS